MAMTPSGFIALLSGWFVTEIGRQPYVVYGLLRTREASSVISSGQVMFSLIVFVVVYFVIFGSATFYILRQIAKGPQKL
jgi:cytochrome d ubiquinol oxidase subunit I